MTKIVAAVGLTAFLVSQPQPGKPERRDEGIVYTEHSLNARLHTVPVQAVHLGEGFWASRRRVTTERSLPTLLELLEEHGVMDNFRRLNPDADDNGAHAALARFLFRADAALMPAGALSGGERLLAALACVLAGEHPPQLLILDEPTNHLDLDSIAAVEQALAGYDGALLIVSHDEDFLEAVGIERRLELGG